MNFPVVFTALIFIAIVVLLLHWMWEKVAHVLDNYLDKPFISQLEKVLWISASLILVVITSFAIQSIVSTIYKITRIYSLSDLFTVDIFTGIIFIAIFGLILYRSLKNNLSTDIIALIAIICLVIITGNTIYILATLPNKEIEISSLERESLLPATNTPIVEYLISTPTAIPRFTPTSTPTPTGPPPTSTPLPTSTPTPLPKAIVESEYPAILKAGQSEWIRISIVIPQVQLYTSIPEATSHSLATGYLKTVDGTPDVPASYAFGPQYQSCAKAILEGVAFDIGAITIDCQSLEQREINWVWNIRSKSEIKGSQILNVRIQGEWKDNSNRQIQRELWRSTLFVTVEVSAFDRINFFAVISGLIGSVLSAPWIYDRIKELRQHKLERDKNKPKIFLP